MRNNVAGVVILYVLVLAACAPKGETARGAPPQPKEIIDLGALVTADLPERVWGKALLAEMKFDRPNSFDVLRWEWKTEAGSFRGSNAYYTLFNHGGLTWMHPITWVLGEVSIALPWSRLPGR